MEDVLINQYMLSGKMPCAIRNFYLLLIFLVFAGLVATCFVSLEVVVKANGILRPAREMTEVKAAASGALDTLFVTDGQSVKKGDRIAVIKDELQPAISVKLSAEKDRKMAMLGDLNLLTNLQVPVGRQSPAFNTILYKEQFAKFLQLQHEKEALLHHAHQEMASSSILLKDKIIAPAEFAAKETVYLQSVSSLNAAWHEQMASWNNTKQQLITELNVLEQQLLQINSDHQKLVVYAPVSGVILSLHVRYTGTFLQAGEILCSISPEDTLIAECYVSPTNIGFLKMDQAVIFRVDAFDHKQFGIMKGNIIFIDPDFSNSKESPVFKIRCSVDRETVSLKNGYTANLRKGMTIQARFIIIRRTIWQLIFDKLHNWFEPVVTV
ncbi:HlyD family secretion protein [Flavihumibacter fluvii]|uniref:HlyD family secretion protein n=1 Tax=Flavihumibacter fluvii TaxID=2838157 RepID=UPI001BDF4440|nr:HlyD family efflux transporter periplasmic adaptor subunit [Flavihumibacter fluvii]ULQ50643.1 HlyD family secretion protein [Flavihumibacter fluvii]